LNVAIHTLFIAAFGVLERIPRENRSPSRLKAIESALKKLRGLDGEGP